MNKLNGYTKVLDLKLKKKKTKKTFWQSSDIYFRGFDKKNG